MIKKKCVNKAPRKVAQLVLFVHSDYPPVIAEINVSKCLVIKCVSAFYITYQRLEVYLCKHYVGEGYDIASLLCPIPFHGRRNKICLNQYQHSN